MKIYTLAENTAINENFKCEHGLSLYIETEKHKILFDMGQTHLFAENAEKLGIDLSKVDFAVLSHGHYDHGGGLAKFLEINKSAKVYLSRYAFGKYFHGDERYIGLDVSLKENPRLVFVDEKCEISKGYTLYSCNGRKKKFNLGSFGLTVFEDGKYIPDPFYHEHYLLVEEDGKKVLVSGCSHKGVVDIVPWFMPDVFVGGFHFSNLPLDRTLASYGDFLKGFDTRYYTCHCTGVEQYDFMKKHIKHINYISSGSVVEI